MPNDYMHPLAVPAFNNFVEAERACGIAWENVKDARTQEGRKIALENFRDIQAEARRHRSMFHKCESAVKYQPETDLQND